MISIYVSIVDGAQYQMLFFQFCLNNIYAHKKRGNYIKLLRVSQLNCCDTSNETAVWLHQSGLAHHRRNDDTLSKIKQSINQG